MKQAFRLIGRYMGRQFGNPDGAGTNPIIGESQAGKFMDISFRRLPYGGPGRANVESAADAGLVG